MSHRPRKKYSTVDKSRQIRFLALVTGYNLVIVCFFALCLFLPDFLNIQDEGLPFATRLSISERILYFHSRIWPAVIALIFLIGLHSFRTVHRLIGPLFRFRSACELLRQGNLGFRIKLRRKDFLHREEQSFNSMLETIAPRLQNMQSACRDALKTMDDLLAGNGPLSPEVREQLSRTRMHIAALGEQVAYFRTEPQEENRDGQEILPEKLARISAARG